MCQALSPPEPRQQLLALCLQLPVVKRTFVFRAKIPQHEPRSCVLWLFCSRNILEQEQFPPALAQCRELPPADGSEKLLWTHPKLQHTQGHVRVPLPCPHPSRRELYLRSPHTKAPQSRVEQDMWPQKTSQIKHETCPEVR